MKQIYTIFFALIALVAVHSVQAQQVYNITTNTTWNSTTIKNLFPTSKTQSYVVNISPNAILTIDANESFSSTKFTGGGTLEIKKGFKVVNGKNGSDPVELENINIILNAEMTINGNITFSNTNLTANGSAKLVVNYPNIVVELSSFTFNNKSEVVVNAQVEFDRSSLVLNNEAKMTANAQTTFTTSTVRLNDKSRFTGNASVTLRNNSLVNIGNGDFNDKSSFYMNASLNVYSNSTVFIANKNNYYGSWSMVYLDGGKTFKPYQSVWNTINCGTDGPNPCQQNYIYGPLVINNNGATYASLPVKLTGFEVKSVHGGNMLTWSTQQEENSDKFIVMKSADGTNWSTIGEVKAAGNSSVKLNYSFTDKAASAGKQYYRLKIVDLDGSVEYSEIRQIGGTATSVVSVFPNPATDFVKVSVSGKGQTVVQLLSLSGKVMDQRKVAESNSVVNFSLNGYAGGLYIIRVVYQSGDSESFKVLVNK